MATKMHNRGDGTYTIVDTRHGYESSPMTHLEALSKLDLQIKYGSTLREIAERMQAQVERYDRILASHERTRERNAVILGMGDLGDAVRKCETQVDEIKGALSEMVAS